MTKHVIANSTFHCAHCKSAHLHFLVLSASAADGAGRSMGRRQGERRCNYTAKWAYSFFQFAAPFLPQRGLRLSLTHVIGCRPHSGAWNQKSTSLPLLSFFAVAKVGSSNLKDHQLEGSATISLGELMCSRGMSLTKVKASPWSALEGMLCVRRGQIPLLA